VGLLGSSDLLRRFTVTHVLGAGLKTTDVPGTDIGHVTDGVGPIPRHPLTTDSPGKKLNEGTLTWVVNVICYEVYALLVSLLPEVDVRMHQLSPVLRRGMEDTGSLAEDKGDRVLTMDATQ